MRVSSEGRHGGHGTGPRIGRWMLSAMLALAAGRALAADPSVVITVTPVPDTVNLRVQTSTTQAAYAVTLVNRSTNVLNDVRFTARTRVDAAGAGTGFVEGNYARFGATPGSNGTAVSCSFGQLRGGGADPAANSRSFVVVFEAPASGERLYLDYGATYKEGGTDNNGNSSPTNDSQTGSAFATLVTSAASSDKQLRSYFARTTGALLYTRTGVPSDTDAWTTTIQIPSGVVSGEARIVEDSDPNSCSPVLPNCVRSAVRVPGSYPDETPLDADVRFLVFTLRRDATTIPTGAQIAKSPIYYTPGTIDDTGAFVPAYPGSTAFPVQLKLCKDIGGAPSVAAAGTPPAITAQQQHCIKSFQEYSKNPAKAPPGLAGDWEWVIWATENGRMEF